LLLGTDKNFFKPFLLFSCTVANLFAHLHPKNGLIPNIHHFGKKVGRTLPNKALFVGKTTT